MRDLRTFACTITKHNHVFKTKRNQIFSSQRAIKISSAYTYIGTDKAECSMSSMFVDVDQPEQIRVSRGRHNGHVRA
eukprot:6201026-Pleurochrysis_carterae.AAC.2